MRVDLIIVGAGRRSVEVDIDVSGVAGGYWTDTGAELTDDECAIVSEWLEAEIAGERDGGYTDWLIAEQRDRLYWR